MANKPSNLSYSLDKSRDVTGGMEMLTQFFPMINFIMFILGWFTVPVEILLRKDFGERWLTRINFYAGLAVLIIFNATQMVSMNYQAMTDDNNGVEHSRLERMWQYISDRSMFWILLAYLLIASYHFFRLWWRNRTNTFLHSFDEGTSRLQPLAIWPMRLINIVAVPIIKIYKLLLPKEERERKIEGEIPPLLNDVKVFNDTIFEPMVLALFGMFTHGSLQMWLAISAPALATYAYWRETAKLNKYLDFRDSIVDAKTTQENKQELDGFADSRTNIMQQVAETVRENPKVATVVAHQYPDLMQIIEDMNKENG